MTEGYIVTRKRDLSLIGRESETDGAPDGMLKTFAQQQCVGRAEAIVVVTRKPGTAIDV